MKAKIEVGAVIPCGQYQNIQPRITLELENETTLEGKEIAVDYIKGFIRQYSEHGELVEKMNAVVTEQSFNEGVEIEYDAVAHRYTYKGKPLIGATTHTDSFYKDFNAEAIAKACAKSWEVDEKDIREMWSANGEIARDLGTLVHASLEHYDKHYAMGEKIKAKNGKENPAMPKHPLLKKIIEDFRAIDTFEGEVKTEIIVSQVEKGFCGRLDRLKITGEKKCRIQDYKINVNSAEETKDGKALAPFDKMPANKLTKYAIQLNIYRQMLEASGWTVEGLDIYAYEDCWKHYALPVFDVI